jgi:hypothetical protein
MHATNTKSKPRPPIRFHGITRHALTLGVNRTTLYRVLTGEWKQLKTLRRRYDALIAEESAK